MNDFFNSISIFRAGETGRTRRVMATHFFLKKKKKKEREREREYEKKER